ncbi:unnamed protein product [Caretta caretta]
MCVLMPKDEKRPFIGGGGERFLNQLRKVYFTVSLQKPLEHYRKTFEVSLVLHISVTDAIKHYDLPADLPKGIYSALNSLSC